MINGLYNSASGMGAEMTRQEVVANNLANVSTVGFKKDEAIFTSFPNQLVHRIDDKVDGRSKMLPSILAQPYAAQALGVVGHGVQTHSILTKFSDGALVRTDRPLDLALHGPALFTVERADGSRAYTRAGNFVQSAEGMLCTQAGELVLGVNGEPVRVQGTELVIDRQGRVLVDGTESNRLLLSQWEPERMSKLGEGLFVRDEAALEMEAENGAAVPAETSVSQGFLEEANTKVVEEMVNMITVTRAYEANQKAIQVQDDSLNKAINEVGRV
jgi:flagellar basal-body rod protein FlgG